MYIMPRIFPGPVLQVLRDKLRKCLIFADYADFLRDDSEVAATATPAGAVEGDAAACDGDQSKYCGLVKSFDMCHVQKYRRQCCASCSPPASSLIASR